jgi:putative ABC transport system permease protein
MRGGHVIPGRRLISWASGLVPPVRRDAWRREWEAEVTWAWKQLHRNGPPSPAAVMRLRLRILTCLIDALWEKKETMTMTGFFRDLRYAVRSLLRYPTFTTIAVATLALGIGANTAVFTLVDGVLLSPLPFDDADELIAINHEGREGRDQLPMSSGLYLFYREQARSIEDLALFSGTAVNLVAGGEAERIFVQAVTPSFFTVLGAEAAVGRTFTEDEGVEGGESVVVLSDGFWQDRFARDPSVIGQSLDINGRMRRIVGVMPPGFGHPTREARLWLPMQIDPMRAPLAAFGMGGVARLAEGQSVETVDSELRGLIARLAEFFPDSGAPAFLAEVNLRPLVRPLKEAVVGDVGSTLWILLGTVGFVLLIACANVANLLLVRAEGRQRELALRVAVGAGRAQVLRSFMGESVALAAAGSVLGILIAMIALEAAIGSVPADLPRVDEIGLDPRVLAFTLTMAAGCALFFGFFPLVRYGAENLGVQLRDGTPHGATGGRTTHRLRNGLVVTQLALALVLLVGSGLMFRSFVALRATDPGFDPERVLTARITVPTAELSGWEETAGFFRTLRERLAAQAGVEAVGFTDSAPLSGGMSYYNVQLEDHPRAEGELPIFARHSQVEVGYFETMGIDVVEGRTFQTGDGAEGRRVAVVGKKFADLWWPGESPIGRRINAGPGDWFEIVGVVDDVRFESLVEENDEIVYWPGTLGAADDPQPARSMDVVIRTTADPSTFIPVLRREVQALNPRIPVSNPRTMESVVGAAMSRTSFTMALLGAASGVALILGLVGIYGVISYVVSQRTREIGVRMALGATAPSVRGMIVRQGALLAAGGVALGLLAAGAMSSIMASLLYGVEATDPLTYASVAVVLIAVSILASWIPAARAAGVDPSRALRSE